MSDSEYVVFMDDDDYSYPHRSTVHLEALSSGSDLSFVSTEKEYGDNYTYRAINSKLESNVLPISSLIRHMVIGAALPDRARIYSPSCSLGVRKVPFMTMQGFDHSLRRLEDIEFVCRALRRGMRISWASEVCMRRFDSPGSDKTASQNAIGEIKILKEFRSFISRREYLVSYFMIQQRRFYFSKNYLALMVMLPLSLFVLIFSPSKIRSVLLRLAHDKKRKNA